MQLGPKIAIFRGFINFFHDYWILIESMLLILIESPNIFHWKSARKRGVRVVLGAKGGPMLKEKKGTCRYQRRKRKFCMRNKFESKKYFHTSHLTPSPAFPKNKKCLLKTILPDLTNKVKQFISRGIGCSSFSRNLFLSFLL